MKFSTLALASLLAQTVTIAQSLFDQQSSGFRLILKSIDNNFNNHALGVCHWSAVHEGLCLHDDTIATPARPPTTFYHNVSSYNDIQGILNWRPPLWGTDDIVSSAMQFDYVAGTNLVYAAFTPGTDTYQLVGFKEGSMYIAIAEDDTRKAPDWVDPPKKVKNWYLCAMRFDSRQFSLAWKIGFVGEPQNPMCWKVDVVRVWV